MRNPYWRTRLANTPFVTYALLAVTFAVFLLETVNGGSTQTEVLVRYGARFNPYIILYGEWWRFITPMFVHVGLMHIVVNAVSMYYLGVLSERLFGHWRFLVIYLVSGIAGNVASFVFKPEVVSAGASTAIFGLLGAFLLLGDVFRDNPTVRMLARQFLAMAVINLAFNLFDSQVDMAGHIGGLLGGFLIAGVVGAPQIGTMSTSRRVVCAAVLVVAGVVLLRLGYAG